MEDISYLESLTLPDRVYIDVRSPVEFADDHIPGSINLPIFDNEERSEIGIIYRMTGSEEAIIKGTEIAGGKLSGIISGLMKFKGKNIVILCFRGGMRSRSVASLARSIGINVYRLSGGYKGYRKYIFDSLKNCDATPPFIILQGLTGTGKTEIIRELPMGIDLENMAGHRSSLFGGIGLNPNSQKKFESLLVNRLAELRESRYIYIEGESKKLGNLHIPENFYDKMAKSSIILIKASMERRIGIILKEYSGNLNIEHVINITKSLKSKIGNILTDHLISLITNGELKEFIKLMLEKYYDPLYKHKLDKMKWIAEYDNINSQNIISILEKFEYS